MESPSHASSVTSSAQGALRAALDAHGAEVFAFIRDRIPGVADAEDVFADFCENLWASLATFRGDCSPRTWCYVIARRAISRHRRSARVRRERLPASCSGMSAELVAEVRSRTAEFLRTETKTRARELRETLPEDDQELLVLRLERQMSFHDIARVLCERDDVTNGELARESARLRKRFQLAKERLAALFREAGLIRDD
jgi:RNA polymerase sigma-70 factor (ECF subfamily)